MSPTPPKQSFAKRVRRFVAWSFSKFQDYRSCPAKAAYKHIDKLGAPPEVSEAKVDQLLKGRTKGSMKEIPQDTDPLIKGSVVHAMAEQFTKGNLKRLPTELTTFKKEFEKVRKHEVMTEKFWGFRSDWSLVPPNTYQAWLWVRVDACYCEAPGKYVLLDYKTGRAPSPPKPGVAPSWNQEKYQQHEEQREIYAIALFAVYPDAKEVRAEHWYTDAGIEYKNTYNREKDFDRLKTKWEKMVKPMMTDTSFVPLPSTSACKFCEFAKSRGGPCRF